ncbi:restriction endonuclease [Candidatus Methanocrinis natronophilus]|uniref:Restriction endonuclease type IV Mrr domain-containing protein n=1 Tax=Candidatus Methanocrinis natronophilus TaxID=3033396 RepID=A0ABT5XAK7_9EURY|nr:restriction endonuclease [Candidatus Methanocrinis natronophilus]MDF0591711.1 hypothetical protein [Candidatus Methanocrinis natronophilus]
MICLSRSRAGCSFEEEFVDLLELNGYRVEGWRRSDDGLVEMAASRMDEVGHEITYVIYHMESDLPLTEGDLARIERKREEIRREITVLLSPSSGFSRSASDLAARQGVRLWGPSEVDRLRRNVAEKRGLLRGGGGDRPVIAAAGKKKRFKAKAVALILLLLLLLSGALLHAKTGSIDLPGELSDLAGVIGSFNLDLEEIRRSAAQVIGEAASELREYVSGLLGGEHKA